VITAFPNIGIVVRDRTTLVVNTGLGERMGATVARVAQSLSKPGARLNLTTTHFHPEHSARDQGFPADTMSPGVLGRTATARASTESYGMSA
jgi:hypothetical protein